MKRAENCQGLEVTFGKLLMRPQTLKHWALCKATERGQGANCVRASKSKGPHNTKFLKVEGLIK